MSRVVYVDTNVFLDFIADRNSAAFRFLIRSIRCEFFIVIGTLVIEEATRNGYGAEIESVIRLLADANKIRIVRIEKADTDRANTIIQEGATHHADAIHIALAEREKVTAIVTQNVKDFIYATRLSVVRADTL